MVDSNFMRMDSFLIYFGRDGDDQLLDLCDRSLCLEPMHLAFPMLLLTHLHCTNRSDLPSLGSSTLSSTNVRFPQKKESGIPFS